MRVTVTRSFAFPYTQDVRQENAGRVYFKVTHTGKRLPMYIVEIPLMYCRLRTRELQIKRFDLYI